MRELHVVARSDDGRHLVVALKPGSLKGGYLLPIDDRLRAALHGRLPADDSGAPPAPKAESALSPKQIQDRLRAGQSPERIAKAAGVPVTNILRFAGPVRSEVLRVLDEAQGSVLTRARRGASAAPLGPAVAANLLARRIVDPGEDAWRAARKSDGSWVISLDLVVRGKKRVVQWSWQPAHRALSAMDTYAAELGHVESVPSPRRPTSRVRART